MTTKELQQHAIIMQPSVLADEKIDREGKPMWEIPGGIILIVVLLYFLLNKKD